MQVTFPFKQLFQSTPEKMFVIFVCVCFVCVSACMLSCVWIKLIMHGVLYVVCDWNSWLDACAYINYKSPDSWCLYWKICMRDPVVNQHGPTPTTNHSKHTHTILNALTPPAKTATKPGSSCTTIHKMVLHDVTTSDRDLLYTEVIF